MADTTTTNVCPKCEQRAKEERQALSQCEQQKQDAIKINQRMAIAVAVLSTLISKEAFDRFTQVSDVVDTLQVGDAGNSNDDYTYPIVVASDRQTPKPWLNSTMPEFYSTAPSPLLAEIPGSILPSFEMDYELPLLTAGFLTDPPDRLVPFAGPMLLLGLTMVRTRKRK